MCLAPPMCLLCCYAEEDVPASEELLQEALGTISPEATSSSQQCVTTEVDNPTVSPLALSDTDQVVDTAEGETIDLSPAAAAATGTASPGRVGLGSSLILFTWQGTQYVCIVGPHSPGRVRREYD